MKRAPNILLSLSAFVLSVGCLVYLWNNDIIIMADNRRMVEQCKQDAARGCPLLYDYTTRLEAENARLELQVRECHTLVPALTPQQDTGVD